MEQGRASGPAVLAETEPAVSVETDRGDPPRLKHQRALDGLRGLAVLAVMVHHQGYYNGGYYGGGFLGVDVFFVLSGFLITSLLLIDHARTGKVISLSFWARRARRLFPALLVFILLVSLYAATVADPRELGAIRGSLFATLLYVQNYWLKNHPGFVTGHMWSLSIEEQFYLVWPLVLALLVTLTRRTKWLVVAVVILACVSAALMAARFASTHSTNSSYLSTETRAQELLIGAALGVLLLGRRVSGVVLEVAGAIALVFLFVATLVVGRFTSQLYEGGFLLVAAASAVLVTACVSEGHSRLQAVLSWRPLVAIGLISYGLYLYHVPMYEFVTHGQHVVTWEPALFVIRFAAAFIVAIASYFWIERPIRRGALPRARLKVLIPAAIGVVVVAILASTASAIPPLSKNVQLQSFVFTEAKNATPSGTLRVLVVGDSLAASLVSLSRTQYSGRGIHGVVEWASGCDALGGSIAASTTTPPPTTCAFQDSYSSAIESFDPAVSVVVLGPSVVFDRFVGRRRLDVGTPAFQAYLFTRLDEMRALLVAAGGKLVLTTVPCMAPATTGPYAGLAEMQRDPRRMATVNQSLRRYARTRDVAIADLGQLLCGHTDYLAANGTSLNSRGSLATWSWLAPVARRARPTDH